jgi:hypothetical protein
MDELKTKQDNLYWEWNKGTKKLDVTWILETEDGKFYQRTKSLNVDSRDEQDSLG